jgi:prephenate dehydrogenase
MKFQQLGLIGCGLMGGSFALAMKRAGLVKQVVGYSKSPTTTKKALKMGVIDVEAPSALLAVSGADLVLVSVPVAATESVLKTIIHLTTPKTLIMDVGSTKQDVVKVARAVLKDKMGSFVPCHPIAGKELSGVEHADVDLYQGKKVILTPTERTQVSHLKKATDLWTALGCEVHNMSPAAHDAAYAVVSHLPHMLAFALMNSIIAQDDSQEYLSLAGTGFRDFTRIAASEPKMWTDIMLANKDELIAQSKAFRRSLQAMEVLIQSGHAEQLHALVAQASQARGQWRMNEKKN